MMRRNSQALTEDYLRWLEPQLRDADDGDPAKTYWDLLNVMFEKEFIQVVPMDDNRLVDGMDLRREFANGLRGARRLRMEVAEVLQELPCSFLEVLLGLSRRLAFNAGGSAPGWAWQLLCHLELTRMSDPLTRHKQIKTQEILDTVIWRKYAPDGTGGFFPLAYPDEDQTKVELWYQMNAYIGELHPEH
jgi:hypothetical protein